MKGLRTRGDNELKTDVPKTRERTDSGVWTRGRDHELELASEAEAITNRDMKLDRTGKLLRGKVRRQLRLSTRLWFRYNGLRPATAKPAGSVQVRLGWVGKSGRGGGCGESRTRLTGPPAYPPAPSMPQTWRRPVPGPGSSSCPAAAKGRADILRYIKAWFWATRSGARASICQICLGGYVFLRNKT